MNIYADLDKCILDTLKRGSASFSALKPFCIQAAEKVTHTDRWGGRFPERVIDRRLQRMRKLGVIRFGDITRTWSIAP